jgi:hypothetical protein
MITSDGIVYEPQPTADRQDCWLYAKQTSAADYGVLHTKIDGKLRTWRVHRLMYEAFKGEIPEGLYLDHLCRVTRCVNPDHLEAVTPKVNALRGAGITAYYTSRTHCVRGHEFTPENTYSDKWSERNCRECARIRAKITYDKWHKKPHGVAGEYNPTAKLTITQVINIMHAKGSISGRNLSKLYGVGYTAIYEIWNGTKWSKSVLEAQLKAKEKTA